MALNLRRTLKLAMILGALALAVVVGKPFWQWCAQQWWQHAQQPSPNVPSLQDTHDIYRAVLAEQAKIFMPKPPPIPEKDAMKAVDPVEPHTAVTVFIAEQTLLMNPDDADYGCAWDANREHQKGDLHLLETPAHSFLVELCLVNQEKHAIDLKTLSHLPNVTVRPKESVMPFIDWPSFGEQYPNSIGFVGFSRPVISDDEQFALVYVSHVCGDHCGQTAIYWLSKHGHSWRVKKVLINSVS